MRGQSAAELYLPFAPGQDADFQWTNAERLTDGDLAACSELFSNHYGFWGPRGPRPKEHVHLSPEKLRESIVPGHTWAALARVSRRSWLSPNRLQR